MRQAIGAPEAFTSVDGMISEFCEPLSLLTLEGDAHAGVRAAVDDRFTPETVVAVDPVIEEAAVRSVGALPEHGTAELMDACFKPVTGAAVAELFGLPKTDPARLMRWADALGPRETGPDPAADAVLDAGARAAAAEVDAALGPVVEGLKAAPDSSFLSRLTHCGRPPGDPRPTADVLSTVKLCVASFREIADATANALHALLTHPEQHAALRADPALLAGWVRESLRWSPPIAVLERVTTVPVRLGAHTVPAGERIAVATASANRDERAFTDPETFDIRRTPAPVLTFGYGTHRCLVRALVPRVLRITLATLLERRPGLRLAAGQPGPSGWRVRTLDRLTVEF
ncbi:cytochrome P450 [Streptomyces sp. 4F14]|uniref:cytochrome P450 n=1 Tax=Streptomyces sp. 4F14 TaxID=3394380 RepID=UPI003A8AE44B